MSTEALTGLLVGKPIGFCAFGQKMADELGIPYLEDSEGDFPTCYLQADAWAWVGTDRMVGLYAHVLSRHLVLVGLSGARYGIRTMDLRQMLPGVIPEIRRRAKACGRA